MLFAQVNGQCMDPPVRTLKPLKTDLLTMVILPVRIQPDVETALMVNQRQGVTFSSEESFNGHDPCTVLHAGKEQGQIVAIDRYQRAPSHVRMPGLCPERQIG